MFVHPQFDPIALQVGPLAIRWYGLMYLFAFASVYLLGRLRLQQVQFQQASGMTLRDLEDLVFYGALGVVIGGRLGYVLFYKLGYYASRPLELFAVWQGGMSFHGGLLGVLLACAWFCHRRGLQLLRVMDLIAPIVPIGLAAGRLGNFINGELWGRASTLPWAMIFPQAGDHIARHPSQLYECMGEGLTLFVVLWIYSSSPRSIGRVSGGFLAGYAILRFAAEFAREPDAFLGLLSLGLSMGQWLCLPMFALGLWLLARPSALPQPVPIHPSV